MDIIPVERPEDLRLGEIPESYGTWEEFKVWCKDFPGFVFRGQSEDRFPIWSSHYRQMQSTGRDHDQEDYLLDLEKIAEILYPEIQEEFDVHDPKQLREFLSILQHHGFPTQLIDVSMSPYMAAYFAVKDMVKRPCRVFAFNKLSIELLDLAGRGTAVSFYDPLPKHNPRIRNQQGLFLFTGVVDVVRHLVGLFDINESILKANAANFPCTGMPPVSTFCIQEDQRKAALLDLRMMGITEYSLFPGLDGLCRQLREQFLS